MNAGRASELPRTFAGSRSPAWWGMVLLIATEATLFGILIASYFFMRFSSGGEWPPDGIEEPTLILPLLMTVLLMSSSVPMHLADRGVRRGRSAALRYGLLATFLMGSAFLALQAYEYVETVKEFTPTTNAYGSLFFTITGFHGLHVLVGLVLIAWTAVRAWLGHFDERRHVTVQNVAMYWHFVDAVWLGVLSTIYLSPNL